MDGINQAFTHSPLGTQDGSIRLLELQPSSDLHSDIQCTIRDANLYKRPQYKALSYVWGDPKDTLPILVNEKQYYVTTNCRAALRRLRQLGETTLWVDVICVNQVDIADKSRHIPLMGNIYSSAKEVFIWLSGSDLRQHPDHVVKAEEDLAFSIMKDIVLSEMVQDSESIARLEEESKNGEVYFKPIMRILSHKWFERLWVHQEITLANCATAVFHYHICPFSTIRGTIRVLLWGLKPSSDPAQEISNIPPDMRERMLRVTRPRAINWSFLELLQITRHCKCLLPHDRIFALLGLVTNEMRTRISLDYHLSITQLYTEVAWQIIDDRKYLEYLSDAGLVYPNLQRERLPSWVIDWRNPREAQAFMYDQYQATSGWPALVKFDRTSSTLSVLGFIIDIVEKCTDIFANIKLAPSSPEQSFNSGLDLWTKRFTNYPSGCDPQMAYIRTLCGDICGFSPHPQIRLTKEDLDQCDLIFALMRVKNANSREFVQEAVSSGDESLNLAKDIAERMLSLDMGSSEQAEDIKKKIKPLVQHILGLIHRRQFFISEYGYMGLGPFLLSQGDMICLIPGCNVPLVVRKHGESHVLMGACFVWGLMDGEAFNPIVRDARSGDLSMFTELRLS